MEQQAVLLVAVALGALLGAMATWAFLRGRASAAAADARSGSENELTRLTERITATAAESARRQKELEDTRAQVESLRAQLEAARKEATQLEAPARQAPILEGQLKGVTDLLGEAQRETAKTAAELRGASTLLEASQREIDRLREEVRGLTERRDVLVAEQQALSNQVTELTANLDSERRQSTEKMALLDEAKQQLSLQFKALAGEILETNSKRFSEQNQASLGQLLDPLKTKLTEFQSKVEEVYVTEGKDRAALGEQVKHLLSLNQKLSQDAHNLTSALKGSSKTQGNWGELLLERILESSGLRKGQDYDLQESHTRDDGSRVQPDVVVHLPEERHLIIDAKVSLVAYEEYVAADDDLAREAAVKRHVDSVRGHIRGLSEKSYQTLYGLKSLDFVLMFMPIEPAFMLAIANDSALGQDAWNRNVLLISPSTLLFVLRTIAHLWRQEQQSRNAQEIAKRGAELYDKLVGFVEDLTKIDTSLEQARRAYDSAHRKLVDGKGNVIRQAQMLIDLGVKPTKVLPTKLIEAATDEPVARLTGAIDPAGA